MIELENAVCMFGSHLLTKGRLYEKSKKFMRDFLDKYQDLTVVTGGGGGIMELAGKVALEKGHKSASITLNFNEEPPHPYNTPEKSICALDFYTRQGIMLDRARMIICFPGGPGTLFELYDAMVHIQTSKRTPCPIYLFYSEFWDSTITVLRHMARFGTLKYKHLDLVKVIDSIEDINEDEDRRRSEVSLK